jgi:hypothetical protein
MVIAQISCFLLAEMQKIKSNHGVMNMRNEKNSKIVRVIQPKCPSKAIGAKQKVLVTHSMNALWGY